MEVPRASSTSRELEALTADVLAQLGVVVVELRDLVTAIDRLALAVRAQAPKEAK